KPPGAGTSIRRSSLRSITSTPLRRATPTNFPSGEIAAEETESFSFRVRRICPPSISMTQMDLPSPQHNTRFESGKQRTLNNTPGSCRGAENESGGNHWRNVLETLDWAVG